jgi:hypothetical protein
VKCQLLERAASQKEVRKGLLTAPTTDATRLCWSVLGRKSETVVDCAAPSPARVSARKSRDLIILWLAEQEDWESRGGLKGLEHVPWNQELTMIVCRSATTEDDLSPDFEKNSLDALLPRDPSGARILK